MNSRGGTISHLFLHDDGTLPELEFSVETPQAVEQIYAFLQSLASRLESENPCYWSDAREIEVPISFDENPTTSLISGDASSMHVLFGGINSPSGRAVPALGVFLASDCVIIDYRMGPEWSESAVVGFFEIIDKVAQLAGTSTFEHRQNLRDTGGQLLEAWRVWQEKESGYFQR